MSADFPSCQLSHTSPRSTSQPCRPEASREKTRLTPSTSLFSCHIPSTLQSPPTLFSTSPIHPPPPPSVLQQRSNVIISHVTAPLDQTLSSKRAPFVIHHRSHASSDPHSSLPPLEHVILGGQRSREDQAASQGKSLHNLARLGAYFATFHNIHMLVTAYIAR